MADKRGGQNRKPAKLKGTVGRPKAIDEAVEKVLFSLWAMGATDLEAATAAGISDSTLLRRVNDDPEFRKKRDITKQNPILKAKNAVYQSLDDPNHAKWYLERKCRNEFSARNELTGKDGAPLAVAPPVIKVVFGNDPDAI